ncbi:MAG: DNA repair protein RadA [Vulcanimicrobiaceae bacterium]
MAKVRTTFFCSSCGNESPRWLGRCPACDAWNSFAEAPSPAATSRASGRAARATARSRTAPLAPVRLGEIELGAVARIASGMREFDGLLGGGIVPGSLVLLGGPPGSGKSTLMLQLAARLARADAPAVYVCGEESAAQTKLRALRVGAGDDLLLFPETDLHAVLDALERIRPRVVVIDSIQTVALGELEAAAGSVAQVRECAGALLAYAKRSGAAVFIVGHVTKDGAIAGPRLLEHLVDTVLYFEGEGATEHRLVRAHKNRFGSVDEICVLRMDERGLHEVPNPSALFLGHAGPDARPSGSCVTACIVGSRPVLVEVQALTSDASYGTPQRMVANLDRARLTMILAVLERHGGLALGACDVYASVAGGLRIGEPAADLGVALAVASAFRGRSLAPGTVAFGELGLSGEVRPVSARTRRIAEARRLGFGTLYGPSGGEREPGYVAVAEIGAALSAALG